MYEFYKYVSFFIKYTDRYISENKTSQHGLQNLIRFEQPVLKSITYILISGLGDARVDLFGGVVN